MHPHLLPAFFISLSLGSAASTFALDRPAQPAAPVKAASAEIGSDVAAETAAAIRALGATPGTRQISNIVFKAVRSSPDQVLAIVHAAARVAPKAAVPEIVTAAVAGVPNPWKQVAYRRLGAMERQISEREVKGGPDFKSGPDGKQARRGGRDMDLGGRTPEGRARTGQPASGRDPGDPGANAPDGTLMTLAEAIAYTAFASQPGLSFPALQGAVDLALRTDPATLLRDVQSSRSISGVGDSGLSNYANEPLRTPKQPVVSR